MSNRREFLKNAAGVSAGLLLGHAIGGTEAFGQAGNNPTRRQVMIGNKRVKTVDVHSHIYVSETRNLLKGTALEGPADVVPNLDDTAIQSVRLREMDREGIDIQALSINPFWYSAERDLAERLINFQNEKLAGIVSANPDRFVAFASVALQFPELAAKQLEEGMKRWGMRGAAIGGSVQGEELSMAKYDPFWAKAEELQAPIFVHPQDTARATGISKRVQGNGYLANVIGNPLETTIFLSHLIMEGVLDRFPDLKICAAHGGGFLPSYADRLDHGCVTFPARCNKTIKKKPTEYLKQIYFDALVFTPEALRHLIAVVGINQVGLGTDFPYPWETAPVDHVLSTPGLSDADRTAVLGGTMCKLLKIPT